MKLKVIVVCALLQISYSSEHGQRQEESKVKENLKHHRIYNKDHAVKAKTRYHDMKCSLVCPIDVLFRPSAPGIGKPGTESSSPKPSTHHAGLPASTSKPVTKSNRYIHGNIVHIQRPGGIDVKYLKRNFIEDKHHQKHIVLRRFKIKTRRHKKLYSYRQLLPNGCHVLCESDSHQEQPGPTAPVGVTASSAESGSEDDSDEEEVDDKPVEATASPGERRGFKRPNRPLDFFGWGTSGWPGIDFEQFEL